ncbi:MAG TPA: 2-phospho-L-lactate guanylyltransferase [Acidimicrobiales bacterium]|nr:2-phospho-L-lactate guanylyltransferase [Acidimicrobiales bacterium]
MNGRGGGRRRVEKSALLVPIKAFTAAKVRLAPVLDADERAQLARHLADGVLRAAGALTVAVVCDDAEVAEWARAHGARVVWTPARGLNAAVSEGVAVLGSSGVELVTVAHADLPLVTDLSDLARPDAVVLAADRHEDGTNVACVPARAGFRFSYGPGSLARHVAEAARLGLPVEVLRRDDLAWDVDVPDDLGYMAGPVGPAPA